MPRHASESSMQELERLRALRTRPERDLSVHDVVRREADHAARIERRLGEIIELWSELVPQRLLQRTAVTSYRRGVLHVQVESTAARYELEQLLRSGLVDALRSRFHGTLSRVKTSLNASTA